MKITLSLIHKFSKNWSKLTALITGGALVLALIQPVFSADLETFPDSFGSSSTNTVSGWVEDEEEDSDAKISISDSRTGSATTGHARLGDGASITKTVNTQGYKNIKIEYYWRGDNEGEDAQENRDTLDVLWRVSGASDFTLINEHLLRCDKQGYPSCAWSSLISATLPSTADDTSIEIKFLGNSNHDDEEEARVDDVKVSGDPIPPAPANTLPSFDPISNQAVDENSPSQEVMITNISPGEESGQTVAMTASSSDTSIIPHPVFSGSGATRTLTYTPVADKNGTVTITVTADDGQEENNIFSRTFSITVNLNPDGDDDNDGTPDEEDAFPLDPTETVDTDEDGIGNNADLDDDNDNQSDTDETSCGSDPLDVNSISSDNDNDNIPDCVDDDDDNDGIPDEEDAFPNDPTETVDTDEDGIGNNADDDDDNDGQSDVDETSCGSNPQDDSDMSSDNDGDNIPDCVDSDDDNDGTPDEGDDDVIADNCPDVSNPDQIDTDNDGAGDACDLDDDNDGTLDDEDAFPLDFDENTDTDGDGVGDNTDDDDDNDNQSDADETSCGSDPLNADSISSDNDGDNIPDCVDLDDDNDGIPDEEDAFPLDPTETIDTDEDGIGNNADDDDDNDGVLDEEDNCSLMGNSDQANNDGDEEGDVCDDDDDNDGTPDEEDAFPLDPNENGSISGYKWEDMNADGEWDEDGGALDEWTIFLDTNDNGVLNEDELYQETGAEEEGYYYFGNLTPGTYIVREVLQEGWTQTFPGTGTSFKHTVTVASGGNEENWNFGNFELVDITGFKWDDTNGDGVWQKSCEEQGEGCVVEPGLPDVIMALGRETGPAGQDGKIPIEIIAMDLTGANGEFVISNIDRGHYKLFEETKSGWKATSPAARADSFFDITYDLAAIGDPDFDLLRIGDPDFDLLRSSFFDVFVELSGHDVNQSEATSEEGLITIPSVPLEFGNHQLAVITNEASQDASQTSIVITWTTNKPATSRVVYDTVSHAVLGDGACASPLETLNCYGYASSTSELDTAPKVVDHSVTVSGLTAGTTYYYRIISKASPESIGNEGTFTTSSGSSGGGGGGGSSGGGGGSSSVSAPSSVPASSPNEVEDFSQSVSEIIPSSDISVAPILALGSQPSENQDSTSEETSTSSPALQIIQTNEQTIVPVNEQIAPADEQDEQEDKEVEEIIDLPQISPFLANISTILTLGTDSNLPAMLIIMLIFLGLAYFGNKVWQKEKNK